MAYYGEEYIYEREEELLDFLRNNLTDPKTSRGATKTDSFTASGGSDEEFTLTKNRVRNVISITQEGTTIYRGYDYLVNYGEIGESAPYNQTVVTIRSTTLDDAIEIEYEYGEPYIVEGFTVEKVELPICVFEQLVANPEYTGVGEGFGAGKSQFVNASYLLEVRDKFKRRCKTKLHQAFNLVAQYRQQGKLPFRLSKVEPANMVQLDFDEEKRAWIGQLTIKVRWEVPFQ